MFCGSGALPANFDRYRAIWHVDFEFRIGANHQPIPVCMTAIERRSGAEIFMRRDRLLESSKAPFDYGTDALVVGYSVQAELSCFQALGWPYPRNVLCTYFETSASINGAEIAGLGRKRPSLYEACDLYGIEHPDKAHKTRMRELIMNNTVYTEAQWRDIEAYNREDVVLDIPMLEKLAPSMDMPAALFRGKYSKACADMEATGLPIDTEYVAALAANWAWLRRHYIDMWDDFHLYDDEGSCREARIWDLIESRRWIWPRKDSGRYDLSSKTFGKMCRRYPELRNTQRLRDQIGELRLGAFLNTLGEDGVSRCAIMPFWARSGRNQPQDGEGEGVKRVFLLSMPSWIHGLIAPPLGFGVAAIDWSGQEIAIGAGLSGDPALIADYQSGDPHLNFAIRTGLAPPGATEETHAAVREMVKPISLGQSYGMTKYGAAAATGKSLLWAAEALAAYARAYPVRNKWLHNVVAQAVFDQRIVSPFGWPMAVHADTKRGTLLNYLHQAAGADCLRLAAIAGREAGISLCAPVHDSLWITAPLSELDDAISEMSRIMVRAGREVCGIDIRAKLSAVVRHPQCFGDVRKPTAKGQALWGEIRGLIQGVQKERRA
jgi:hypothetical protein